MTRIVSLGLAGAAAGLLSLGALAQQAPPSPTQPAGQPTAGQTPLSEQAASPGNRVRVTGMIPPPDVGNGAPYHSPEEITEIASTAQRDAVAANSDSRTAGRSDACRDSTQDMNTTAYTGDPIASRIPGNTLRLQGLYRNEKSQATRVSQLAGKALEATNKAEDARRDAADGRYDKARVDKTEIARQKAVNDLEKARLKLMETQASIADYGDLVMRRGSERVDWIDLDEKAIARRQAGWGLGAPKTTKVGGLRVGNMKSGEFQDDNGFYILISGVVANMGTKDETVPEFIVTILDSKGFPLRNMLGSPQRGTRLQPQAQLPFRFVLRPSPEHIGSITVNFASGKEPPLETPVSLLCEAAEISIPGG
ncbi:MAG TPA: hypothetical protein VGO52_09775 [Hyphomonadaceae bacterium]|jgi:hypothetical protein|nr:hypothetical protein [Hyphomonadaceae bacterium]